MFYTIDKTDRFTREVLIQKCRSHGLKIKRATRWDGRSYLSISDRQGNLVGELRGTEKSSYLLLITQ